MTQAKRVIAGFESSLLDFVSASVGIEGDNAHGDGEIGEKCVGGTEWGLA